MDFHVIWKIMKIGKYKLKNIHILNNENCYFLTVIKKFYGNELKNEKMRWKLNEQMIIMSLF